MKSFKLLYKELGIKVYYTTSWLRIQKRYKLVEGIDFILVDNDILLDYNVFEHIKNTYSKSKKLKEQIQEHRNNSDFIEEKLEDNKLKLKNRELTKENSILLEEVSNKQILLDVINSTMLRKNDLNKTFNPYTFDDNDIVPCIMLSDLHWGKVIRKSYVFGTNEYNMDISDNRLEKAVNKFINFYKNKLNYDYKEIIVVLGGDLIENDLGHHNEQDGTVVEQILRSSQAIIKALNTIKNTFINSKIRVIGVVGNHGRQISPSSGKYMPTYNILKSSYEYLIFNNIISAGYHIEMDDTNEVLFEVMGIKVALLHGYEVKLNTKSPNSIMNSLRNKYKQFTSFSENHPDIFLLNHYHKPFNFDDKLIIGGSIVGFDDYSKSLGFEYFHPCLTSFAFNNRKNSKISHYHLIEV